VCCVWFVCLLCLTVVSLPSGKNLFAVKINNNNNNNNNNFNEVSCDFPLPFETGNEAPSKSLPPNP
jgi:hypothetical protein